MKRQSEAIATALALFAVAMSVAQPSRIDIWQYGKWYVEASILQSGGLVSCTQILGVGNYEWIWASKICTRLSSPLSPLITSILTIITSYDFTGDLRRWFLITPLLKGLSGYLLLSLYIRNRETLYLGSIIFILIPDYSVYYLTQVKGLSLPLLWLGFYTTIRWRREGGHWILWTIAILLALSLFYFPRVLLLVGVITIMGVDRLRKPHPIVVPLALTAAILYVVQGSKIFTNIHLLTVALLQTESLFSGSQSSQIPYFASNASWGYALLAPLAIIGILGATRLLYEKGPRICLEERALWSYGILIAYLPAALLLPFFRTRVIFELAAPAAVVGISGISLHNQISRPQASSILFAMILITAGTAGAMGTADSYQSDYNQLHTTLEDIGVTKDTRVFTDFKTGAFLVGEKQYKQVYRITSGKNRTLIYNIWYSSDGDLACQQMKSRYGVSYFILSTDIQDGILIENYRRQPVIGQSFQKFAGSESYSTVATTGRFQIYRLEC